MSQIRNKLKKITRDNTKRPSLTELLNFWENFTTPNGLVKLVGAILLILASVAVGLIGSARVHYAREFYPLTISTDFLEDIQTGTKVRYQGALVVGEVTSIESDGQTHLIHIKIKKDFHVPRMGSLVNLNTWGYFGGKFINIDILESARETEPYPPNSILPMEPMVNSSILIQKAYDYFKKEDTQTSLLEKQLLEAKSLARLTANSPYFKPRNVRTFITSVTEKVRLFFVGMEQAGQSIYVSVDKINAYGEQWTIAIQQNIRRLRKSTEEMYKAMGYQSGSRASMFLHEETEYEEILNFLKYANKKSRELRNDPYKMFFD